MSANPDPGDYYTKGKGEFGSDVKTVNMGSKYKHAVNNNPGPGNYDSDKGH